MKNHFFYLTAAILTATFATAETSSVKGISTTDAIAASVKAEQYQSSLADNVSGGERNFSPVEDKTILNPENVIGLNSGRSMEEVIAENNKITESSAVYSGSLLYIEKPIEEIIAEDNKIIESNISLEAFPLYLEQTIEDVIDENNDIIDSPQTEIQPLDFKAIDRNTITTKNDNKLLLGMN